MRKLLSLAIALLGAAWGIAEIEDAGMRERGDDLRRRNLETRLEAAEARLVRGEDLFVQDPENPVHHWSPAGTIVHHPPVTDPDTGDVIKDGFIGPLLHSRIYTYLADDAEGNPIDVNVPIAHVVTIVVPGLPICDMDVDCERNRHDPECEWVKAFRVRADAAATERQLKKGGLLAPVDD
ncbi:MAG: hypothetical protein GY719_10085 [bacterium]|nr:hypothetical protein [bacterium]